VASQSGRQDAVELGPTTLGHGASTISRRLPMPESGKRVCAPGNALLGAVTMSRTIL